MSQGNDTCWTLVGGAGRGDEAARSIFARAYEPVVRAFFEARWRSGSRREHVDDATQEVFLDCFGDAAGLARAEPGRPGGFRAYLGGICKIVALRQERRLGRRREFPTGSEYDLDRAPAADEAVSRAFDRAWANMLLRAALTNLIDHARRVGGRARDRAEAFRLRIHEGLTVDEIASRTGRDPKLVYSDIHRGRGDFRDSLRRTLEYHGAGEEPSDEALRELMEIVRGS